MKETNGVVRALGGSLGLLPGQLGAVANYMVVYSNATAGASAATHALNASVLLSVGGLLLLTGGISGSIKEATKLEQAMVQVDAISQVTGEGVEELARKYKQLSIDANISREELLEFSRQGVTLGIEDAEGLDIYTKTMADLRLVLRNVKGEAPGLEETGREIVKFLRSVESKDLNADLQVTANTLVQLKTRFGAAIPEIIGLATYFSSGAKAAGVANDEILALSAALVSVGARPQAAGSSLQRMFAQLEKAVAGSVVKQQQWAGVLGITVEKFKEMVKESPAEVVALFSDKLAEADKAGQPVSVLLDKLGIKGQQYIRTANELVLAHERLGEAFHIAAEGAADADALQRAARAATQNWNDSLGGLGQAFNNLKADIGTNFLPIGTLFFKTLTVIVQTIDSVVEAFNHLPSPIRVVITALATGVITINLARTALKALGLEATVVSGIMARLGVANAVRDIALLDGAGVLAAGRFAGLGAVLTKNFYTTELLTGAFARLRAVNIASIGTSIAGGFAAIPGLFTTATGAVSGFALTAAPLLAFAAGVLVVAGAAVALGVAVQKITADIDKTYAATDAANKKMEGQFRARGGQEFSGSLDKIAALGTVQAELAQQAREAEARGDAAAAAALRARADRLGEAIVREREHARAILEKVDAHGKEVRAVENATAKYGELSDKLIELRSDLEGTSGTPLEKALDGVSDKVATYRREIEKALALGNQGKDGGITQDEADNLSARADRVERAGLQAAIKKQLDEDARTIESSDRDLARARLEIERDARRKREGERDLEVREIESKYAPLITTALANAKATTGPDKSAFLAEAGRLQQIQGDLIAAARAKASQDLERLATELQQKVASANSAVLAQQASTSQAIVADLGARRDRAVALAGDEPKARLDAEQRFGPQLLAARLAQLGAQDRADRDAAAVELSRALEDAKSGGARKGELELAARSNYLAKIRTLEITEATARRDAQLEITERLQQAQAAIYQKDLDAYLKNLSTQTGAELAAARERLLARRASAVAEGNTALVSGIDRGLEQITDRIAANARDFNKQLGESGKNALDLRQKLSDIDLTPLGRARSQAASPFNDIIRSARKEVEDLQKAYGNLTPQQQQQGAGSRLASRLSDLQGVIEDATVRREAAVTQAQADFERKRQDQAQLAGEKLARTRFEAGQQMDTAGYALSLAADRKYWNDRLASTLAGLAKVNAALQDPTLTPRQRGQLEERRTQLEERADGERQNLAGVDGERARLADLLKNRAKDARDLAREEAAAQVTLAKTEADRAAGRARQVTLAQDRLVEIGAELGALRASKGSQEEINALERERLGLQSDLAGYGEEDRTRARELQGADRARLQGTLDLARGDEARVSARANLLASDRTSLANATAEVASLRASGATREKITEAVARQLELQKSVRQLEEDERAAVDAILASRVALAGAQASYDAQVARTDAAVTASMRSRLQVTAGEIADLDRRIAQARDLGQGEAAVNALLGDRLQKQAQLDQQATDLARRPFDVAEQETAVLNSQLRLRAQLAGLADDDLATARLKADETRREVEALDRRLAAEGQARLSDEDRRKAVERRNDLLAQQDEQQRAIAAAGFTAAERQGALLTSELRLRAQLAGLADDDLASARLKADETARELDLLNRRLAAQGQAGFTPKQREEALARRNDLLAQQDAQARAVAGAELAQQARARELSTVRAQLAAILAGRDDAVSAAEAELRATRSELAVQEDLVANADRYRRTSAQREGDQKRLVELQLAEARGVQAVAAAQRDALSVARARLDAEEKLARTLAGQDDALTKSRADLRSIQRERAEVEGNLRSPDLGAKDRATLEGRLTDLKIRQAEAEREVERAGANATRDALSRLSAQQRLAALLSGRDLPSDTARADLADTERDLAFERNRLANATALGLSTEDRRAAEAKITELTTKQVEGTRAVLDADRARLGTLVDRSKELERQALANSDLADDPVANAALALAQARRDLALASRDVAGANTDAKREEALSRQRTLTGELASSQRAYARALAEDAGRAFDLAQARERVELRLRGLADDTVATAELDLRLAGQKLAFDQERLRNAERDGLTRREQVDLEAQILADKADQLDKERALTSALQARATLVRSLAESARRLADAAGTQTDDPVVNASRDLATAARERDEAVRQFEVARSNFEREPTDKTAGEFKTALDNVTGSVDAHRKSVASLSEAYRKQVDDVLSVIDAVQKLDDVLNPAGKEDDEKKKKGPVNFTPLSFTGVNFDQAPQRAAAEERELNRLEAFDRRRQIALQRLRDALKGGDAGSIAGATNDLSGAQEAFQNQVGALGKIGVTVTDNLKGQLDDALRKADDFARKNGKGLSDAERQAETLREQSKVADRYGEAAAVFAKSADGVLKAAGLQTEQDKKNGKPAEETPLQKAATLLSDSVSKESHFTTVLRSVFEQGGMLDQAIARLRDALKPPEKPAPKPEGTGETRGSPRDPNELRGPGFTTSNAAAPATRPPTLDELIAQQEAIVKAYRRAPDAIVTDATGKVILSRTEALASAEKRLAELRAQKDAQKDKPPSAPTTPPDARTVAAAVTNGVRDALRTPTPGSDRLRDLSGSGAAGGKTVTVTHNYRYEIALNLPPNAPPNARDLARELGPALRDWAREHRETFGPEECTD